MNSHQEFIIAFALEPFVAERFTMWPLHITVVPWFEAPSADAVVRAVRELAKGFKPFKVNVNGEALFGKRRQSVRLIKPDAKLQHLHESFVELIMQRGWKLNGRYTGEHFKPHVTAKQGRQADGELYIDRLHIVEALPQMYRQVVAEVRFG